MYKLNLPDSNFKITKADEKTFIFDAFRKKNVILTPEEWVRQHFISYLVNYKQFPKALIKVESGLRYNKLPMRSDILVYDRSGNPLVLVECKAYNIKINAATFAQVSKYNQTIKAPYIMLTNGMQHYCCRIDFENKEFDYLKNIPIYEELL